jgi:hypothetical protein
MPTSYTPRSVQYSDSEVLRLRNTAYLSMQQHLASYPPLKAIEQIIHGHEINTTKEYDHENGAPVPSN